MLAFQRQQKCFAEHQLDVGWPVDARASCLPVCGLQVQGAAAQLPECT